MPGDALENYWANSLRPPNDGELEVSLFGPGYGECVVIHIGWGDWIVVDSCVTQRGGRPVALNYLDALGFDPASAVKLVVATHWHDDHVRGLADVVRSAENAEFACSAALQTEEFLALVEASERDAMMASSGVDEFRAILKNRAPDERILALGERVVYKRDAPYEAEVHSLTPSDAAYTAALHEIARLLPKPLAPKGRIGPVGPNHASVVLWVRVGSIKLLLGADLQEDPGRHWTAVLTSNRKPNGKADLFKIPHHGSSNADHPRVWSELVQTQGPALLTPFQRGSVILPTPDDEARICSYDAEAYITADIRPRRARLSDRAVERTVNEVVKWMRPANSAAGQICARRAIVGGSTWDIQLIGPASRLCA